MEELIPIVNKLQDVFSVVGAPPVELPQLVVVGSQSAGKSSVLEHIVGKDFLPRGSNIVTRRPLILQIINTTRSAPAPHGHQEWGTFLHCKDTVFADFEDIRAEILRETERVTGTSQAISRLPIRLTIYSPHVINLTLVDLPGLTKLPVGDQPTDIEAQIREMILEYITPPTAVIVAVSPATTDLANSEALKLAREVDPSGKRTIGVITKLDLMDQGTDALDVLQNKVIRLQHGFVGVVNRSQMDINKKTQMGTAAAKERHFFQSHAVYGPIADRQGSPYLTSRLNMILIKHIQLCLPALKGHISRAHQQVREEMERYGAPLSRNPGSQGALLLHMLYKFCTIFCDTLEGKSPEVSTSALYGGARISYVFHDIFAHTVDAMDPFETLSDRDICTAVRNATGPRPSLFIPEVSFELLVKMQIERLLEPSILCAEQVYEELRRVAVQAEGLSHELARFPLLQERLMGCVQRMLKRQIEPCTTMITNLVRIELAYINTNHPHFLGGSNAVASLVNQKSGGPSAPSSKQVSPKKKGSRKKELPRHSEGSGPNPGPELENGGLFGMFWGAKAPPPHRHATLPRAPPLEEGYIPEERGGGADREGEEDDEEEEGHDGSLPPASWESDEYGGAFSFTTNNPTEREMIETEIIKNLISSYFNIVKKNVQDSVPKAVMCFLVNHCKQHIQNELVKELYKDELFAELLEEGAGVADKRTRCAGRLEVLGKAMDVVTQIAGFRPSED
jgi:dynamin 1-like protein